jgi:hypothetical protein
VHISKVAPTAEDPIHKGWSVFVLLTHRFVQAGPRVLLVVRAAWRDAQRMLCPLLLCCAVLESLKEYQAPTKDLEKYVTLRLVNWMSGTHM